MSLATLTVDINAKLGKIEGDMGKLAHLAQKNSEAMSRAFRGAKLEIIALNSAFELAGKGIDQVKRIGSFFTGLATDTANAQDEMGKLAQKAGMGAESFSALSYAVKLAGGDQETLVKASKALSVNLVEASRAADQGQTVFGGMGIQIKDTAGKLRATDQILLDVAGKFAGMEDGANKSALAVSLFGKSGLDLVPFLNQGKEGIQALTKEAERLGVVVSGDAFAASEKFNDNLTRLATASEGVKRSIGNAALPMLNELVQQMTDNATSADSLGGSLRQLFSQGSIEEWARGGAMALAWIIDAGQGVVAIFKDIGGSIGAGAAAIVQVLQGNFEAAQAINEQWQQDSLKLYDYSQARDKVDAWFDEYSRTVRVNGEKFVLNNAEDAKRVQKIYDDFYAGQKQKSTQFVEFDEAALKKQESLRVKYGEEEKRRQLGDIEFAKQKIREKYEAEINALRGAKDEAFLTGEIHKKMDAEIAAVTAATLEKRILGEDRLLDAVRTRAAERAEIEGKTADEIIADQMRVLNAKVSASGGSSSADKSLNEIFAGGAGTRVLADGGTETTRFFWGGGFATGGSFLVGGAGGTDSQLVAFKASPDERVTIETPAQQRAAGGGVTININGSSLTVAQMMAAIKQALRTDPDAFSGVLARSG